MNKTSFTHVRTTFWLYTATIDGNYYGCVVYLVSCSDWYGYAPRFVTRHQRFFSKIHPGNVEVDFQDWVVPAPPAISCRSLKSRQGRQVIFS